MGQKILFLSAFLVSFFVFSFACEAATQIVSEEILFDAEMKLLWQNQLSLKNHESIEEIFLKGENIYVLTDRNYFYCLDNRDNGKIKFGRQITRKGFPVFEPILFGDELIVVAGNEVLVMNPENGQIKNRLDVSFVVSSSAVRNSGYYYVPSYKGLIYVYDSADDLLLFAASAEDGSKITSVIADEGYAVFSTNSGKVIAMWEDRSGLIWDFQAVKSIGCGLVSDGGSIYAASEDTNLYKLNASDGSLEWRFESGGVLFDRPVVTERFVYQSIRDRSLVGIDKSSGEVIWSVKGGVGFLSESDKRAYVMTNAGVLKVMDNIRGGEVDSVDFYNVEKFISNTTDSNLYVADKSGRIACIAVGN